MKIHQVHIIMKKKKISKMTNYSMKIHSLMQQQMSLMKKKKKKGMKMKTSMIMLKLLTAELIHLIKMKKSITTKLMKMLRVMKFKPNLRTILITLMRGIPKMITTSMMKIIKKAIKICQMMKMLT